MQSTTTSPETPEPSQGKDSKGSALQTATNFARFVKLEHSVFALPFAMVGLIWASQAEFGTLFPSWTVVGLVVLAMISARSSAMAFNRIVDRHIDAKNPRTSIRELPSGKLSLSTAYWFLICSVIVFFASAALLNPLAFALSPVALIVICGYSLTKRFTWLSHYVLGLSLGIAPAAAWIATTGRLDWMILPAVAAVTLWTAGFDIIYSLQDEEFDKEQGLHSVPQRFGSRSALTISRVTHLLAAVALGVAVFAVGGGWLAWAGVALVGGLLSYEQSLVRHDDLSRVDAAFFTVNGFVSIGFFVLVLLDVLLLSAGR